MEQYIKEVDKLENTTWFFECMCINKKYDRYNIIAELCENIGIIYKPIDNIKSLEYLLKSYNYYVKVYDYNKFDKNKLKPLILLIAEQLELVNYNRSIEFYLFAIEIYAEKGDIKNVIKYYEKVYKLYFDNNELELSKQILEKIILIIGNNQQFEENLIKANENLTKITFETVINVIN